MCRKRRFVVFLLIPLTSSTSVSVHAGQPDLVPLNGLVIIRFHRPLDQLVVPKGQLGVFKHERPGHVLRISQEWIRVDWPHRAHPTGLLRLKYNVPDDYCGWWLKLLGSDWSDYQDGLLVLRLRPTPGTPPQFKLELKRTEGGVPHGVDVTLEQEHRRQAKHRGYADVAVPLSAFGIADLSHLAELVIVLESHRLPRTHREGELLVESIRLVRDRKQLAEIEVPCLLDDLGYLAFQWFQDNWHPQTGMVLDRSPNRPDRGQRSRMATIAGAGYHLSLLPEWVRQGWLSRKEAERQARQTLRFATSGLAHYRGLYYHFFDVETGHRFGRSEVSLLDSAIFFNGCMVAAEAFGTQTAGPANALIDRADWTAFLVRHPRTGKDLLALGWTPEKGLLSPADVRSSEMAMAYFLAVGSRSHPIGPQSWYHTDVVRGKVAGHEILNPTHPLFTALYGLGWHDLRGRVDRDGVDLYANAQAASLANRAFCRQLADRFSTFRSDAGGWWAISAGDSPEGYVARGPIREHVDGTVWPLAALASLPWMDEQLQADLYRWRSSPTWHDVCGRYGLAPFNRDRDWVGDDLLAIDLGSFAVSLANLRHRTIWDLWMRHPVAMAALRPIGLTKPR